MDLKNYTTRCLECKCRTCVGTYQVVAGKPKVCFTYCDKTCRGEKAVNTGKDCVYFQEVEEEIVLSEEEKQMILKHRKNQSKLEIKNVKEDNNQLTRYNQMTFQIKDECIQVNTVNATYDKKLGFNTSSCGFYSHSLTEEDVKKLRDYLDYFLGHKN